MAIKSKTQLATDISTNIGASYNQSNLQTVLDDIVDSYEDIFAQIDTATRNGLTPSSGQIIYNTDSNRYEYWNGSTWFGIGQDLSTPLVVKVDLSSADLLSSDTIPITVATAAGVGYALLPTQFAIRYTYGSAAYSGTCNGLFLKSSTKTTSDYFGSVIKAGVLNQTVNKSGLVTLVDSSIYDAIVENDSLELKADGTVTTGDGTLTVWVTYSIIVY